VALIIAGRSLELVTAAEAQHPHGSVHPHPGCRVPAAHASGKPLYAAPRGAEARATDGTLRGSAAGRSCADRRAADPPRAPRRTITRGSTAGPGPGRERFALASSVRGHARASVPRRCRLPRGAAARP
jgi:hypothetical protein